MNTNATPSQQDTMVLDGADQTAEEARLAALPLDGSDDEDAAETARLAEEERAAAAAAADTTQQTQQTQQQAAAVVEELVAPTAPTARDFDAERAAIRSAYDAGDLNAIELADKREALLRAELAYQRQQEQYEDQQRDYEGRVAQRAEQASRSWNVESAAWEADNKDFLSNPLRHADMQRAIRSVHEAATAAGRQLTPRQLLEEAGAAAMGYSGYVPPKKEGLREAIDARRPGAQDRTLGDVPNAGTPAITGNETFAQLDALGIQDLEETMANMRPDAVERYLRDSPGSNSRGTAQE